MSLGFGDRCDGHRGLPVPSIYRLLDCESIDVKTFLTRNEMELEIIWVSRIFSSVAPLSSLDLAILAALAAGYAKRASEQSC